MKSYLNKNFMWILLIILWIINWYLKVSIRLTYFKKYKKFCVRNVDYFVDNYRGIIFIYLTNVDNL